MNDYTVTCPDGFQFFAPASEPTLATLETQARTRAIFAKVNQMSGSQDVFSQAIQDMLGEVTELQSEVAGVTAVQTAYNNLVQQNQGDAATLQQVDTAFATNIAAINQAITANTPSAGSGTQPVTTGTLQSGAASSGLNTAASAQSGTAAGGATGASVGGAGAGGGTVAGAGGGVTAAPVATASGAGYTAPAASQSGTVPTPVPPTSGS